MATKFPTNIFHSARLQLTLFYLAIILFVSLTISVGYRLLAVHDYESGNPTVRSEFRHLFIPPSFLSLNNYPNVDNVMSIEAAQEAHARHDLDLDVFFVNIIVLVVGGTLSYWFAERTLKPIEKAHDLQKRFASDASHELRTPLTNMKVENEVFLRQKDFSQAEARKLIESNLEEVQRLNNLAGNLLSMNQYENVDINLRNTDIDKILDQAISSVDKIAASKSIKFDNKIKNTSIIGNKDSLVQLFSIILDNAVKFGPEKSKVYISSEKKSGKYLVKIRDEGQGIKSADLPNIFERFYRGDKSRSSSAKGYGLGLSLAAEIADVNESKITATNSREGGAEFTVHLNARN
jgi:signal transduction histidine kinase